MAERTLRLHVVAGASCAEKKGARVEIDLPERLPILARELELIEALLGDEIERILADRSMIESERKSA